MTRSPDMLFMAEYIKNVLYFATVRQGKVLKDDINTHYFCIDNELTYENYYSDFGPLNLGCIYKYCGILNEKLKTYINKQAIVHYTSIDPKKKANAAFLLGCYGVLYLGFSPKDALKPLLVHGQSYRPFQDATQGAPIFTISITDCLHAIKKAQDLRFFNLHDFNYEEYERLDKIQGGDLNWIVPGKFLAFIGPVDYSVSLYHPPEIYIDYFLENNVRIVIRLNKRMYDGNVFNNVGITHYDLYFPDGSCPPRHILFKFLQISEETECAIAVHCKAGLGRTGSLIGCYLMKHYRMTAHEAIGWMRICRPGSVIGHQQEYLEQLEPWLIKQGNLYRKRTFQNTEMLPIHNWGVYSIAEKNSRRVPKLYKTSSPMSTLQRYSDLSPPLKPQASRLKEEEEDEEVTVASCDLTIEPSIPLTQLKGLVLKTEKITEENDDLDQFLTEEKKVSFWKKCICCYCCKSCNDITWMLAVHCAKIAPSTCASRLCNILDRVSGNMLIDKNFVFNHSAFSKTSEKESYNRCVKPRSTGNTPKVPQQWREQCDMRDDNLLRRRSSAAGEPRIPRTASRGNTIKSQPQRNNSFISESNSGSYYTPVSTFRSQQPVIQTVNEARNFFVRCSRYNDERERLHNAMTVTPQAVGRPIHYTNESLYANKVPYAMPSSYSSASKTTNPCPRRRLGRSPSPPQARNERSRATNTAAPAPPVDKICTRQSSTLTPGLSSLALKEALSRLKLTTARDGSIGATSIGAASLGARRDAPSSSSRRAPSCRSDQRPLATQGDMLNSIKFQRSLRESIHDKQSGSLHEKNNMTSKEKSCSGSRGCSPLRPSSPKGRRNTQSFH